MKKIICGPQNRKPKKNEMLAEAKDFCRILFNTCCTNKCVFCDRHDASASLQLLKIQEMQKNSVKAIAVLRSRGYRAIEICGEDPLEYVHLMDFIRILKKTGFTRIMLSTNGVKLAQLAMCQELMAMGVNIFRVPLYGSSPQVHDDVTKAQGSFQATVQGIGHIKALQGRVILSSLLLKQNCLDLPKIFDLMHNLKCDDHYFSPVLMPLSKDTSYYIPHHEQGVFIRTLIDHAAQSGRSVKLKNFPYCVIGSHYEFMEWQPDILTFHALRGLQGKDVGAQWQAEKIDMCKECRASLHCCGLYLRDVQHYGTGELQPICE